MSIRAMFSEMSEFDPSIFQISQKYTLNNESFDNLTITLIKKGIGEFHRKLLSVKTFREEFLTENKFALLKKVSILNSQSVRVSVCDSVPIF